MPRFSSSYQPKHRPATHAAAVKMKKRRRSKIPTKRKARP